MGFTRYYDVKETLDPEKFKQYSKDCKTVCDVITEKYAIKLASGDGTGSPVFTDEKVHFNGVFEDSHEDFLLSINSKGFNFTKTQYKPYDKHVLACLILAKKYFKDSIKTTSDGDSEDQDILDIVKVLIRDEKINDILNEKG